MTDIHAGSGTQADAHGEHASSNPMWWANANAALWAIGNGLVSTLLVIYLASDLGAKGLTVSLILAAPRFAGLLRLGVPALMGRLAGRKPLCMAAYVVSSLVLCGVPAVAALHDRISPSTAVAAFVFAWCAYHVTEYVGTVALWSWLGDLTPERVRGWTLGRREFWLTAGRIAGIVVSALLALVWSHWLPETARWKPLALSSGVGAAMMLLAVIPLAFMPGVQQSPSAMPKAPWRHLWQAVTDRPYRRLLLFNFGFSIANGFTATAQERYPIAVLNVSYTIRQFLQGVMRSGQLAIAPWAGRLVDRFGNRPVMIVSQLVVSLGVLCFLLASPAHPWWIAGAFIVWSAYAGLNVGLDNIKLKLAPEDNNAPFVAIYHTVGDLANGVTIVIGGVILDQITAAGTGGNSFYTELFIAGFAARLAVASLLAWLIEPGAMRVRDLLADSAQAGSSRGSPAREPRLP
jgi:MFS family permease